MVDYQIGPALMGGVVKEISDEEIVKINLNGRLGVVKVPRHMILDDGEIVPGHKLQFYFSYIQIVEKMYDYDSSDMNPEYGITPTLLGGKLTEVNDTAVEVEIMDGFGRIAVPRRWVFTPVPLKVGLGCEFYFSRMQVVGKRSLPVPPPIT